MPNVLKQPLSHHIDHPYLVIGYKYYKAHRPKEGYNRGWQLYGYYCPHCSHRRLNPDIIIKHVKTCKHTRKKLKAREGLVRALEGRSWAYAKTI